MKPLSAFASVFYAGIFAASVAHAEPPALSASRFGSRFRDQVGVNIHFGGNPKPGELAMLGKAGFRFVRMDRYWKDTEKQPGVYDFGGA
jgi:hypothetical protein